MNFKVRPLVFFLLNSFLVFAAHIVKGQATSNSPVCEGETLELNANINASTYAWSGPGGFSSNQENPTITAVPQYTGTFTLVASVNGSDQTFTVEVTVNNKPAQPQVDNRDACRGETLTIAPNNPNPDVQYRWNLPGGNQTNGNSISVNTNTGGGTYQVTATNPNTGCESNTEVFNITVYNTPQQGTFSGATDICEGEDLVLNATNTQGNTVTWRLPNETEIQNNQLFVANMDESKSGSYTLRLSNPGCAGPERNIQVDVVNAPTGLSITGDTAFCEGDPINLSVAYSGGSLNRANFLWSGPNNFFSNNRTIGPNAGPATAGTYQVTVTVDPSATDGRQCTSDPVTTEIEVFEVPQNPTLNAIPGIDANDSVLACELDEVTIFEANNAGSNATFNWEGPNGTVTTDTLYFEEISLDDVGSYELTVVNGPCSSSVAPFAIGLTEVPVVTNYDMPETLCDSTELMVIPEADKDYDYTWIRQGDTLSVADTLVIDTVVRDTHFGEWLVVPSFFGCEAKPDTIDVNILRKIRDPQVVHVDPELQCEDNDMFLNTGTADSATFFWSGPDDFFYIGFSNDFQNVKIDSAGLENTGVYTVIVSNLCGSDTGSAFVRVLPRPQVELFGDTGICDYETTEIYFEALNSELDSLFFDWSTGDTTSRVTLERTGEYALTITNEFNCELKRPVVITDECDPIVYVPNAFSPNGDGLNDRFEVFPHNVRFFEMWIYTATGDLISYSEDPDYAWDGGDAPKGMYFYRVVYTGYRDGELSTQEVRGSVQLIR